MQETMNQFLFIEFGNKWKVTNLNNQVSEQICDFSYDSKFDNNDASVDGMVCILQKKT